MSLKLKKEMLVALKESYAKAGPKQRKELLDSFVTSTGYNRKYAITLLSKTSAAKAKRACSQVKYDAEVKACLLEVWRAAGYICSKRLMPFLGEFLPVLRRCNYLQASDDVQEKLLRMSAATADRLLRPERKKLGRQRSTTRAGHLLRSQIAIRTFKDWDGVKPGFFEIDLVAHNGGRLEGQCVHTFTLTDVASGWTEVRALLNKGEDQVMAALPQICKVLPMDLLGLDSDNGGEFINHKLESFCESRSITFTRGRHYEKNDQNYVEEKNGSVVRKLVGYGRLEGEQARRLLDSLYRAARLYVNYFQPSVKLAKKERIGSRVRKTYHVAKTPCQRLINSDIPASQKSRLQRMFATLDPIALLGRIELIQGELSELSKKKEAPSLDTALPVVPQSAEVAPKSPKESQRMGRKPIIPEHVVQEIHRMLLENPRLTTRRVILAVNKMQLFHLNITQHTKTVQRLLQQWRDDHPEFLHCYPKSYKKKRTGDSVD
jgi:polyhydroxyalkanoate synthesis regulator phasin